MVINPNLCSLQPYPLHSLSRFIFDHLFDLYLDLSLRCSLFTPRIANKELEEEPEDPYYTEDSDAELAGKLYFSLIIFNLFECYAPIEPSDALSLLHNGHSS